VLFSSAPSDNVPGYIQYTCLLNGLAFEQLASLHWSRLIAAQALVETAVTDDAPCDNCGVAVNPIRWFTEWKVEAKEELALRPTIHVAFSLEFLGSIWAVTSWFLWEPIPREKQNMVRSSSHLLRYIERKYLLPSTI